MFRTCLMPMVCGWIAMLSLGAEAGENLAVDASFESPLPAWFAQRSGTSYYAGKEQVRDAADGRMVLAIEAWDTRGSRVVSEPIRLIFYSAPPELSATVSVRSFGAAGATIEWALFDEKGIKKLASFGEAPVDGRGQWQTISKTAVRLAAAVANCRLALVLSGPSDGARVEVDCVGLFPGPTLGTVDDNSDLAVVEAETLADGLVWKVVDHYPSWYQGTPSGMQMLAGFHPLKREENHPVVHALKIRRSGPHTLWIRYLAGPYAGRFTVALRQGGTIVAQKEIAENDAKHAAGYTWVWESIGGELRAGDADIVLTRPAARASWVCRKIDLFVLTNRPDYVPQVEHLHPRGYLRFTNLSTGQEPFCLWLFVRRHQGPRWYANPGILSRAGLSEGYSVPPDKSKWLAPGRHSPWVPISDYLLAAGGRNNLQLIATRRMHTDGFVAGRIQGRLEFALGENHAPVKTIAVDQNGPRLLMTLPYDLQQAGEIKTALDYIAETEARVARLGPVRAPAARWLNLAANLSLQAGVDDPKVLRREIGIIKSLGFNQTYHLIAPPETAVKFYEDHGLLTRFGGGPSLWAAIREKSQHHPDPEAMDKSVTRFVEANRPLLPSFVRCKLMDEPGGMSYESIARSEPCRQKFRQWLKAAGLTLQELRVASWDDVTPVEPKDRDARPELFYHSGLFRLEAFATLAKACVAAKQRQLPAGMLTYVNYSPPTSGGSWTERGTDPFLAHRAGGMEMVWTEDWLGYSVGPQHLSDTLALARAAGRGFDRRLGAYCVGQGSPTLMRMKYYTLAAGGVRDIECYDYGPWYAGIDSWGRNFDLYPAIRDCNFELGAIDAALHGTRRRATQIAILYNRTASIWVGDNNSCAMNGSFTHWALAHAGYDADFLAEEDLEQGVLAGYKVLYLDGRQLRRPAAQAIAAWVEQGGVLLGSAGAGARDQYDRPMDVLENVFAARSQELLVKGNVNRPRYELRALKPLDELRPVAGSDAPAATLEQLCFQERLTALGGGRVILANRSGEPAGVVQRLGRGTAIRLAALPGVSYVHQAIQPPYAIDSYLPQNFPADVRDFLAWPAQLAGATRIAAAECPIAEIVRYDGPDRAVVFVIDHRTERVGRFTFDLFDAAGFNRATAASGARVELAPAAGGVLRVSLPLAAADAVVLRKAGAARP